MGSRKRVGSVSAANRRAAAAVGQAGTGNLTPIRRLANQFEGAERSYANRYIRVLTGDGDVAAARQFATESGLSTTDQETIENAIEAGTRRLTDRRRRANRG